jgi:hypothetical protein
MQANGENDPVCTVRKGGQRDARLYSLGANATHAARRTNADKQHAVKTMLADAVWSKWSDIKIAAQCGVSDRMVAGLRPKLSEIDNSRTVERGSTTYPMETGNIGKGASKAPEPKAEAEEVAEAEEPQTPQPQCHPPLASVHLLQHKRPPSRHLHHGLAPAPD